jgi:nucleotidyltransferase substrate binding protein (TIGR01987 family)
MERLKQRIELATQALTTLDEVLKITDPSNIERDACIQRFECSFEAVWKTVKRYLYSIEGIEANSPKSTIRASFELNLLNENQSRQALVMTDDRNLTSHTYNQSLADEIMSRIHDHAHVLHAWLNAIKQNVSSLPSK